jgi:CRP-like cAMP-binding protein
VGDGKTILTYRKNEIVFSQGELADALFYIQNGNIKLIVVSEQGKEAVVAILGPGHFLAKDVSMDIRCASRRPRR